MNLNSRLDSLLNTEFSLLPYKFGDPEIAQQESSKIEEKLGHPISSLFDTQAKVDKAKHKLGSKTFKLALSLFFTSLAACPDDKRNERFSKMINDHINGMARHLGKDKICYIKLLLHLRLLVDQAKENEKKMKVGLITKRVNRGLLERDQ